MKINFKKIEAQTSFEGAKQTFDVADAVEIPEQYCKALELVVKNSRLIAAVKRAVINQLNVIQPS